MYSGVWRWPKSARFALAPQIETSTHKHIGSKPMEIEVPKWMEWRAALHLDTLHRIWFNLATSSVV